MDRTEALRSIYYDHLTYIQRKIPVDFDNRKQQPVEFRYEGKVHHIDRIIVRFKMLQDQPANGFLVETRERSIFCLYSQLEIIDRRSPLEPGFWVLSFRIQNDDELMSWYREDRKMLTNSTLQRIVNFHGHVCPELAVGGKFCEFAQGLFHRGTIPNSGFSVVVENTTSAVDAIQVLLGVTVGNKRLAVIDYGKHTYSLFSHTQGLGWKLKLRAISFGDENTFTPLLEKIEQNNAMLEDVVHFQRLLDSRVQRILAMKVKDLFTVKETTPEFRSTESVTVYRTCAECGEQVIASHSIEQRDRVLCMPCFQSLSPGCSQLGIQ